MPPCILAHTCQHAFMKYVMVSLIFSLFRRDMSRRPRHCHAAAACYAMPRHRCCHTPLTVISQHATRFAMLIQPDIFRFFADTLMMLFRRFAATLRFDGFLSIFLRRCLMRATDMRPYATYADISRCLLPLPRAAQRGSMPPITPCHATYYARAQQSPPATP